MANLLREYNNFECEVIKEEVEGGKSKFVMKGILQRATTLNQNGRIYPREVLERELRNYQKLIRERRAMGALDHTDSSIIELKTVSHIVTEAYFKDDVVYGKVEILPTPHGETLRKLVESGVTVGISSRGVGSTATDSNGYNIVQDDFQLICWDFVSEPSTPGAFMMKEGIEISDQELRKFFNKSDRIDRAVNNLFEWDKLKEGK
jgi:hypothetical protein